MRTIRLAAALAAFAAAQADGAKDIVCWTDDQGLRACGDHVPPQFAQKQREVYDPRGVLLRILEAQLTPEQRAEAERRQQQAQTAQQQQQRDNFLLQTYGSVAELKAARDNRLQTFDVHIELAQKAVNDGAASVQDLRDRAEAERAAGRDPDAELLNQIKSFENLQADNIRALVQLKQDREAAAVRFDSDIQRYQELRSAAAAPPPNLGAPAAPQP